MPHRNVCGASDELIHGQDVSLLVGFSPACDAFRNWAGICPAVQACLRSRTKHGPGSAVVGFTLLPIGRRLGRIIAIAGVRLTGGKAMAAPPFTTARNLVFWEPTTSPHKAQFFEALARLAPGQSVIECADRDLGVDRASLGWSVNRAQGYRRIVAPDERAIQDIFSGVEGETLHVFSGIRWVPTIVKGLETVRKTGARFAILSEPRVREGWKGQVRVMQSLVTEGWLRRRVEFVLAIGRNGPPWFARVGYASERIFPFAYFVDPPRYDETLSAVATVPGVLRIGYLGRLVASKGVSDVILAGALLGKARCAIWVAGAGPHEVALRALAAESGVAAAFCGVIPMRSVGSFLSNLDVLVLASRTTDDGWGVVVSEALMCGTTVVATETVGASLVLDPAWLGKVVPAGRPDRIAAAIDELAAAGAFGLEARERRASWARSVLSAAGGARHLLQIIAWSEGRGSRPTDFHRSQIPPDGTGDYVPDVADAAMQ
jgi:glycosyltransferase involved in cell wall biosynthesis